MKMLLHTFRLREKLSNSNVQGKMRKEYDIHQYSSIFHISEIIIEDQI